MLLLDTHAWIWIVEGDSKRVGRRTARMIAQAAARGAVRVSSASVFEIVALYTLGRVRLTMPPEEWIETSLTRSGIRVADLTRGVAVDAGFIPRTALADPLDRVLVATARQNDATLVTGDAVVLGYAARTGNVRVHELAK